MKKLQRAEGILARLGPWVASCVIGASIMLWGFSLHADQSLKPSHSDLQPSSSSGFIESYPASLVIDQPCEEDSSTQAITQAGMTEAHDRSMPSVISPFHPERQLAAMAGHVVRFDWAAVERAREAATISITGFPLSPLSSVDLALEQFSVFDGQSKFIACTDAGEVRVPPPDVVLYRGSIEGDPASHVFLGLSAKGVNGYLVSDSTIYMATSGPVGGALAAASQCTVAPLGRGFDARPEDLLCSMFPEGLPDEPLAAAISTDSLPAVWRRCLMLVECDYDFYKRLGSDLEAATGYAAILMGAVSEIYERDIATSLWLNVVRVWTTIEDPYVACGLNGLEEFKNIGNAQLLGLDWNLAYRMSGCGGGGSGFYDAICRAGSPRGRNPYATSAIQGFFPYPVLSDSNAWDLFLVSHEIGHNFGSLHTHCFSPPIDRCRGDEGGCYRGVDVCERGTIMSYCFRCNGIANVDLRFHPRVAQLMSSHVAESCFPVVGQGVRVSNSSGNMAEIDSIKAESWLSVGPPTFRLAAGASRVIGIEVDWPKVKTSTASGTLVVYARSGGVSDVISIPVTAQRRRPFPDFSATADSGCWPLTVGFTDLSTIDPVAWKWNFGDGTTSELQSPVHTYQAAGNYPVTFTAVNGCGSEKSHEAFVVKVHEAALCCYLPPLLLERFDSVTHAYDLWACTHDAIVPQDVNTYEVTYVGDDSCGISVSGNRYLSVIPLGGWYGQTWMRYRATDPDGCRCEKQLNVIVNDPPRIHLLNPPQGVDTINGNYDIRWTDSDRDENARINLYFSAADACTGGTRINQDHVFEDQGGASGAFHWVLNDLPDGYYRLNATIADVFTMYAECSEGVVLIDRTAPVTHATMACTRTDAEGWCDGEVRIEITASDTLTGVAGSYYSLNGAPDQLYTGPFNVALEGATTLSVYSVDRAGNVESRRETSQPVRVDTSPPSITGIQADNHSFVAGDFASATPTLSIQLTDAGVGVAPQQSIVTITPGTESGPIVFTPDSAGFSYDPVTRRITINVSTPLQPGAQLMEVAIVDLLANRATASFEFTIGTKLEMLEVVNHPNPFRRETSFTFKLTEAADVTIRIFDLSGETMRTLVGIEGLVGYNEIHWDGLSQSGLSLANGAYFYEIVAKGSSGSVRHLDKLAILR